MAQNDNSLHVNVPLTDTAIAYRPDEDGYLWSELSPVKAVSNISNYIRTVDRANLMTIPEMRVGAQGTGGNGGIGEVTFKMGGNALYRCIDYAINCISDARERANADSIVQYDQELIYTGMVKANLMFEKVAVKETLRDSTNYAADQLLDLTAQAADQWDNDGSPNSDPIADILTAVMKVKIETGGSKRGKYQLVMHEYVWNQIRLHRRSLARSPVHVVGSPAAIFTKEMFEKIVFGDTGVSGELIITSSRYNTALEGATEDFRSFIGPDVLLLYSEPASTRSMGFMNTFMFAGAAEGINFFDRSGSNPLLVYTYPDPARGVLGSDVHRIVGSVDFKVLYQRAGYLLKGVVDKTNTALYQNELNN